MTIHIYFYGLISFIGEGTLHEAVLITYPGHRPEIVTATDRTTAHDGAHVVFVGADGVGATACPDFLTYVPSLSTVIKPPVSLKPAVVQGIDNTSVNAFVTMPKGELHVADFYEKMGEFKFANDAGRPMKCLARLTYMSIDAASTVFVVGGQKQLLLPADGWVLVRNTCLKGGKDFKAHRGITTAVSDDDVAILFEGGTCELAKTWPRPPYWQEVIDSIKSKQIEDLGQIECSSSRFP
jgi:hypothetical protein